MTVRLLFAHQAKRVLVSLQRACRAQRCSPLLQDPVVEVMQDRRLEGLQGVFGIFAAKLAVSVPSQVSMTRIDVR